MMISNKVHSIEDDARGDALYLSKILLYGYKPYFGVSMVWNAMNKAKYYADDIALPETSIKPYVKYGVGVQKTFSERLSSFAQAFVTNGGRNGVGLQAGVSFVLDVNRF